jgi:hypothetical protein
VEEEEDVTLSDLNQKVYKLRDSIDSVVKYRVMQKNAKTMRAGRKIVDKEADLYEKMVFLPEIKEPVIRKKAN